MSAIPVPGELPRETATQVRELRDYYIPADLYRRLDAARKRRYPRESTLRFITWLLDTSLLAYEDSERRAEAATRIVKTPDEVFREIDARRLIDQPPPHTIRVHE